MDYSDFCEGVLIAQLATTTTTGVTVKLKQINGTYPTFPTGACQIMITQKSRTEQKVEKVNVAAGSSQTAAGVVTLGTLTRKISLTDGTDVSGTGTAQSFVAGAQVYVTWTASDAEQTVKKNETNTLTGSGAIRSTSTTTPAIRLNNVTEAQRDLMTASNGDMVYNTDTGVINQYVGSAWVAVGDAGTADATATTAGKVEVGVAADNAASTGAGDSGALVVVPTSLVVKTSSGAGDENKIACLDASGQFASGFIPASSNKTLHILATSSTNAASFNSSTSEVDISGGNSQYTILANELAANTLLHIRSAFVMTRGAGAPMLYFFVGGTKRSEIGKFNLGSDTVKVLVDILLTCKSAGATGTITQSGFGVNMVVTASTNQETYALLAAGAGDYATDFTLDTTATNLIKFAGQWDSSNASNAISMVEFSVNKLKV